MGKIIGLSRRDRAWPKVPRRWPRGRGRRLSRAPWQRLAMLVGVVGALWHAAEVHSNIVGGDGGVDLGGRGSFVQSAGVEGHGRFALCGGPRQSSCVVDGDTIRYGGVKIRLADIDAPEVFSPKCASEAALGRQATERLLQLINAGPFQVVQSGWRDEDRYGRKLRVIARAGRSLGATLVAEGLARRWDGVRRSWCG